MTTGNRALLPYQAETHDQCCLGARAGQAPSAGWTIPCHAAMPGEPAGCRVAANEIVWIHALHAVELCQRAAELAARRQALEPA